MRRALVCILVGLALGCGEPSDDDGRPSVAVTKGTARIRCGGGDCSVGVVHDGGLYFVGATRTRDGVSEQRYLELLTLQSVDIQTGAGNDRVSVVDASIPGRLYIATG
jgi:hypothetical protein